MTGQESCAYQAVPEPARISAEEAPCFPFVWGDAPVVRVPGEHEWQQQPFYNQDWRSWCRRCGWLVQR